MATIWLVEDDASIGAGLDRTLTAEGYDVVWSRSCAEVSALSDAPDLLLLDLGLPDGDGLDICRRVAEGHPATRIIILTARASEIDVVVGLDAGAVDYIAKPFHLAVLLARVRAQLRGPTLDSSDPIVVGDLVVERGPHRARIGERELLLRPKEFDLLVRLAIDAGSVVRRDVLMSEVWDEHYFGDTKTLDVHIAALRRRLGDEPGGSSRITTVRGVGYRLEERS